MAIALVAQVSIVPSGTGGGTSAAMDTTGATLLVFNASWYTGFTADATVSDSKSNTWTPLTKHISGSGAHRFFYCLTPSVGTGHTFTIGGGAVYAAAIIGAFSGVVSYQTESGAGSESSPLACGSVTPLSNGALIVTGLSANQDAADAVTPGFSVVTTVPAVGGVNMQSSGAYLVQTTAAAINPTWSWSGGGGHTWIGVSAAVFLETTVPLPIVVSSSSGRATSTTTLTVSHTVPVGTNRYLVVLFDGSATPTYTATYGGIPLTNLSEIPGGYHLYVFGMKNPPVGTANVVFTGSGGSGTLAASVITLINCVAIGSMTSVSGTSTDPSITVSSAIGGLVLDLCATATAGVTFTVGAGQASILEQDGLSGVSGRIATSSEPGAASVTMSWTLSASGTWIIGALTAYSSDESAPTPSSIHSLGSVSSLTWSHKSDNKALFVSVVLWSSSVTVSSLTYGGGALTYIGRVSNSEVTHEWWWLESPTVGTADIVITTSSSIWQAGGARNVDLSALTEPYANLSSSSANTATPSLVVTPWTTTGGIVLDMVSANINNVTFTPGAGQTAQFAMNSEANTEAKIAGSSEALAATVTMSWTLSSSEANCLLSALSITELVSAPVRTTQAGVELVLSSAPPPVRFTQAGVEIVLESVSPMRITQAGVEMLVETPPAAGYVTQLVVETLISTDLTEPAAAGELIAIWIGDMGGNIWIE